MKKNKFFIISAALVAFVGICIFIFSNIDIKNTNVTIDESKTVTVSETTSGTIISNEQIKIGSHCLDVNKNITTQEIDGEIVAEYEEYVFGCFCDGKAIEGFEFKSSKQFAGPNCEKRCAKICQNKNFKVSYKCLKPANVDITTDIDLKREYFSKCVCMISENGSEPIGMDLVHALQYQSDTPAKAEQLCNNNCQSECEMKFGEVLKKNPDFKMTKRW